MSLVLALAACHSEHRRDLPTQTYLADGKRWTYSKTEINYEYLGLHSPHGLIGMRSGYRELHMLDDGAGHRLAIQDHLYAKQNDGSYRHIRCCDYFKEKADLYDFDHHLVLVFSNARALITTCFIYPAGHPTDESEPDPAKRYNSVKVYALYDPADGDFKTDTFDAGDIDDKALEAAERQLGYARGRMPIDVTEALMYAHRRPFQCQAAKSG